jgi:hypothetical protein
MTTSLTTQVRIAELREKGRSGTLSLDECKEAIIFLRQERLAMPAASAKPRTTKPVINGDDLLGELGL